MSNHSNRNSARQSTSSSSSSDHAYNGAPKEADKKTILTKQNNNKELTNSLLSLLGNNSNRPSLNKNSPRKKNEILTPRAVFTFESPFSKFDSDNEQIDEAESVEHETDVPPEKDAGKFSKNIDESDKDLDILELLNSNKKNKKQNVKEIEQKTNKQELLELQEIKKEISEINSTIKDLNLSIGKIAETIDKSITNKFKNYNKEVKEQIANSIAENVVPAMAKVSEELIRQSTVIIEAKLTDKITKSDPVERNEKMPEIEIDLDQILIDLNRAIEKREARTIVDIMNNLNNNELLNIFSKLEELDQRKLLAMAKLMSRDLNKNTEIKTKLILASLKKLDPTDESIAEHVEILVGSIENNLKNYIQDLENNTGRRKSSSSTPTISNNNSNVINMHRALQLIHSIKNTSQAQ